MFSLVALWCPLGSYLCKHAGDHSVTTEACTPPHLSRLVCVVGRSKSSLELAELWLLKRTELHIWYTLFCLMEKMPEATHQFASLWDYVPCAIPPKMAGVRTPAPPTINVSTYDNGTLPQRPHWRIIGKYMFIPTYIIPRMLTLPKTKCKHFYQKERKQNKTTTPTTKHSKVQTRAWHFE